MDSSEILENKIKEVKRFASMINAPSWLIDEFVTPKRVIKMGIRTKTDKGKGQLTAIRVHHRNPHATGARPYKGGLRFHPGVTEDLLKVLAMDMTEKCILAGLPFGGAKGGIAFNPNEYTDLEVRRIAEQMAMEMMKDNIPHPDIDVPGPDMGTNPTIMYWMYVKIAEMNQFRNIPNSTAMITGKPIEYDGIPGRSDATSHGLLIQLKEFIELEQLDLSSQRSMAIQGFGNVGSNAARLAEEKFDFSIVAVSDKDVAIYNPSGLPMNKVFDWYDKNTSLKGFPEADEITNEELLELEVDILVPAAVEDQITKDNADNIKAKVISEGANEAITSEAHQILFENGIHAIPGIVANAGGVVVSYFEWRRNRGDRTHAVDFDDEKAWVYSELSKIMKNTLNKVHKKSKDIKCSISDAAHILAMEMIRDKLREKHSYPLV